MGGWPKFLGNNYFGVLQSPMKIRRREQKGAAALVLVTLLMISMVMGISISNWVNIQRRGDLQMRVATKEHLLAQNAIQEARLRMFLPPGPDPCVTNVPQIFTYFVGTSTITVRTDCNPYP
jgi:hypothetical protein